MKKLIIVLFSISFLASCTTTPEKSAIVYHVNSALVGSEIAQSTEDLKPGQTVWVYFDLSGNRHAVSTECKGNKTGHIAIVENSIILNY